MIQFPNPGSYSPHQTGFELLVAELDDRAFKVRNEWTKRLLFNWIDFFLQWDFCERVDFLFRNSSLKTFLGQMRRVQADMKILPIFYDYLLLEDWKLIKNYLLQFFWSLQKISIILKRREVIIFSSMRKWLFHIDSKLSFKLLYIDFISIYYD